MQHIYQLRVSYKSGSGLVTLVCDEEIQNHIVCNKLSEAMTANYNEKDRMDNYKTRDAIGIGCGMGIMKYTLEYD